METERATQRVWEADLGEAGRKLTLDELRSLELMHICLQLRQLVVRLEDAVRFLSSLEGRFDRLETFLTRLDPQRYPRTEQPSLVPPRVE